MTKSVVEVVRQPVSAHVERFVSQRRGQTVYVEDVEKFIMEQNGTHHVNRNSVQNTMKVLVTTGEVEELRRGRSWKILEQSAPRPAAPETGTYFEKIGELTDGGILLKCENGIFYRAVPL